MRWKTRLKTLDLSQNAVLMGILNVTPNSFSDGGDFLDVNAALDHALVMISEGAGIIDIGGESTRPGAATIDSVEEIRRTIPVIKALRDVSDVLISIDTSKSSVAKAALDAGADIVNDVTGLLGDREMAQVCIDAEAGVCVMHMQGTPRTMQESPAYDDDDVVLAVQKFFSERLDSLVRMGMNSDAICFDPGIGFGKTQEHNLALLRNLSKLQGERPLLLGVSRKSVIRNIINDESVAARDTATATITALAYEQGIRLHRVHNVLANQQALDTVTAISVE
ncbi:dihydropteroate synthase [Akkermansiaceae bacterium]|nr:dihydropteroate synthase [Akkermansiaceae bacterium]